MHGNEDCSLATLDLSSKLPIQTAIESSSYCKAKVDEKCLDSATVVIKISGSNEYYIDMSQLKLYVKFKVCKTGGVLVTNENVSLANNCLQSMIKNIQVLFGTTVISSDDNFYHYKAIIENTYGFNKEYKACLLSGDGLYKDSNHKNQILKNINAILTTGQEAPAVNVNPGYVERNMLIKNRETVELCGNLHLDISSTERFLIDSTDIVLNLTKNDLKFLLKGADAHDFTIVYQDIYVFYRKCKIANNIRLSNNLLMERSFLNYPIKRVQMQGLSTAFKSKKWSIVIATNILPNRFFAVFVRQAAQLGDFTSDGFNFEHHNIVKCSVRANDSNYVYASEMNANFKENNFREFYSSVFQSIKDAPNDIEYSDYKNGYTLIGYNLSADLCSNMTHTNTLLTGTLTLDIELAEALDYQVTAIIYAEYDNLIQINKTSIIKDYN